LLQNGQTDLIGPALTALNGGQLPASFILLAMASRWERKKWPLFGAGMLAFAGLGGILTASGLWGTIASAALIGFACAIVLTLVLALPALLVAADEVPRVSAGVFAIGYGVAVINSILGGIAWDLTGNAAFAFLPVGIAVLPIIAVTTLIDLSKQRP
jgi:CP family cyanate transporter-like MFS transporter